MTMREIVQVLRDDGHKVEYRNRKDGGILITAIDSTSFTGASGNNMARILVGDRAKLSASRKTQLKIIKPAKGKKEKIDVLTEDDKAKIKEIQKIYSKNKVPISQGRITRRLIRKIIKEEGRVKALEKLQQAERYASGFATSKTLDALTGYINQINALVESELLDELVDKINANDGLIRDEWIKPAYDALYMINKGKPIEDVVNEVETILHLK